MVFVCEEMGGMRSQWTWQATINMRRGDKGDTQNDTSKDRGSEVE